MKINTVWAAYFSATDTTKTVVTQIAKELARHTGWPLETFDFTLPQTRKTPKAFGPGDLVVFGTPVYAGRVPNLLIKYVASVQGNGALAVPVVCYGNRHYDDALMELRNTLRDGGFHPVAGAAFSCQHAFSPSQNAGRPDISDLTIAAGFAYDVFQKVEGHRRPRRRPRGRARQRPRGPLLHPPGPPRQPHQHPPGQAQDQRRLHPVRSVRPAMSPGGHRCGGCPPGPRQVHEVQPLREALPRGRQVL